MSGVELLLVFVEYRSLKLSAKTTSRDMGLT